MNDFFNVWIKNIFATAFGLFGFVAFAENSPDIEIHGGGAKSISFLLLTITIPSLISGIVTIMVEYFRARRSRRK